MQKKYEIYTAKFNDTFTKNPHKQYLKTEHHHHPRASFIPNYSPCATSRKTLFCSKSTD